MAALPDIDPQETDEWLDALDGVLEVEGPQRAHFILERLIEKARRQAMALFEQDPDLKRPEHQLLAYALQQSWGGSKGDIS